MPRTNTYIPVNAIEKLDFLISVGLLEVFVQMILPLEGSDTLAHERVDIVIDVLQKDIQTTQSTL